MAIGEGPRFSSYSPRERITSGRAQSPFAHISEFEQVRRRPLLSAVVINRQTARPRIAFFELAERIGAFGNHAPIDRLGFFAFQLARVFDYWQHGSSPVPPST